MLRITKVSSMRKCAPLLALVLIAFVVMFTQNTSNYCDNCFLDSTHFRVTGIKWNPQGVRDPLYDDYVIYERELAPALTQPTIKPTRCDSRFVFFVMSCPHCVEQRSTIRSTWASNSHQWNATVIFALGLSKNATTNAQLRAEHEEFDDLVQFNYVDSYRNITVKVIAALNYAQLNCNAPDYVLKVDDDIYYNLPLITSKLRDLDAHYLGSLIGFKFYRQEWFKRNSDHKQFVPREVIRSDLTPSYLYGWLEIYGRNVISGLLHAISKSLPLLLLEDVFITGFMAEKAVIKRYSISTSLYSKDCSLDDPKQINKLVMIGDNCLPSDLSRVHTKLTNYNFNYT